MPWRYPLVGGARSGRILSYLKETNWGCTAKEPFWSTECNRKRKYGLQGWNSIQGHRKGIQLLNFKQHSNECPWLSRWWQDSSLQRSPWRCLQLDRVRLLRLVLMSPYIQLVHGPVWPSIFMIHCYYVKSTTKSLNHANCLQKSVLCDHFCNFRHSLCSLLVCFINERSILQQKLCWIVFGVVRFSILINTFKHTNIAYQLQKAHQELPGG